MSCCCRRHHYSWQQWKRSLEYILKYINCQEDCSWMWDIHPVFSDCSPSTISSWVYCYVYHYSLWVLKKNISHSIASLFLDFLWQLVLFPPKDCSLDSDQEILLGVLRVSWTTSSKRSSTTLKQRLHWDLTWIRHTSLCWISTVIRERSVNN